jgi:hypothetical protein
MEPIENKTLPQANTAGFLAPNEEDAEDLFIDAKSRFLDINHWQQYFSENAPAFHLADHHGNAVKHLARKGDFFSVSDGVHTEWLKVSALVYDDFPDQNMESLLLNAHITASPAEIAANRNDNLHTLFIFRLVREGRQLWMFVENEKHDSTGHGILMNSLNWNSWAKHVLDFSDVL